MAGDKHYWATIDVPAESEHPPEPPLGYFAEPGSPGTPGSGTGAPQERFPRNRHAIRNLAIIFVTIIVVISLATLALIYSNSNQSTTCNGCITISTVGMAGSIPSSAECGSDAGLVHYESISVTSTSSTVTTSTLGLKVIPTSGGIAVTISTPGAWTSAGGGACPTSGWWAELVSPAGSSMAWFQSACQSAPCWSASSGGTTATSAVALTGGQTIVVFITGQTPANPAGAFTMQAYGLGGSTVSGSVDL